MQEKTFSFMAFPNCLWNVEDVDHFSNLRIFRKKDGGEEAVKGIGELSLLSRGVRRFF